MAAMMLINTATLDMGISTFSMAGNAEHHQDNSKAENIIGACGLLRHGIGQGHGLIGFGCFSELQVLNYCF